MALLSLVILSRAQEESAPGRSIGTVSTLEQLIVIELNDGALGKPNLFDLSGRTLRFIPENARYRVENSALQWDADFGPELSGSEVTLQAFTFPFSGQRWSSFSVGATGSIRFGASGNNDLDPYGHHDGGVAAQIGRFDQLTDAAAVLIDTAPSICAFLKPRMAGPHFVKELRDRVVITWDVSEPFGSLLDFTWFKTTNLFQAVLHSDGAIEMSYKELSAKDAIVGVYPVVAHQKRSPSTVHEAHLSSLTRKDGPFSAVYESFHYVALPKPQDLACTVINALGDRFDFLAYYSDFRVDNQEASSPSDGPIGGNVTGIGETQHDQSPAILGSRCTKGRFQLGFQHPIYVGSNEMQERPPDGAPAAGKHDLAYFRQQLVDASPSGEFSRYNYAVGHLGHEVAHRWGAYVSAKVNGETISLGSWPHWDSGLQAPAAFPYSLPTEASTLGGSVWQDNFDGTFTQLRDGYFVPATGYSYLDLYLMGLISAKEVPDFFLLKKLTPAGNDTNDRPVFKAERTRLTVRDVIRAEGQRTPDVAHSQRKFNTGIVIVVEHGRNPTPQLIERADGIRHQWMDYWSTVTGRRASMTTDPR